MLPKKCQSFLMIYRTCLWCTKNFESVRPLQGSKSPKSGKEGLKRTFGVKTLPFPSVPEMGALSQKIPIFLVEPCREMGIFWLKAPISGTLGNGSFLTPKPSFPDFGDFDPCRGRTLSQTKNAHDLPRSLNLQTCALGSPSIPSYDLPRYLRLKTATPKRGDLWRNALLRGYIFEIYPLPPNQPSKDSRKAFLQYTLPLLHRQNQGFSRNPLKLFCLPASFLKMMFFLASLLFLVVASFPPWSLLLWLLLWFCFGFVVVLLCYFVVVAVVCCCFYFSFFRILSPLLPSLLLFLFVCFWLCYLLCVCVVVFCCVVLCYLRACVCAGYVCCILLL